MKKTLLILILGGYTVFNATADVSISDVLGSYKGNLKVDMEVIGEEGSMNVGNKENVEVFTLEQEGENLTFLLKDFSLNVSGFETLLGDIKIEDVQIDKSGTITKGYAVLDKTDPEYDLGLLPTTINGTLLPTSTDLNIKVIWEAGNDGTTIPEETPGLFRINVKYDGTKATNSIDETKNNISIINIGNSIEFVGADLNAFSIYNIQGKLVSTGSQSGKNIVDFSEYNNGIYIIKANTNKGTIIKKIIKN